MKAVKKRFAALAVGAVLVLGMLCGFAVPHVYAIEERRAQIVMYPPQQVLVEGYVGVRFGWQAQDNDTLIVGDNINPNYGRREVNSSSYSEVHLGNASMKNFWGQAVYKDVDGRKYYSTQNRCTAYLMPSYMADGTLSGYFNPGDKYVYEIPEDMWPSATMTDTVTYYCTAGYRGEFDENYVEVKNTNQTIACQVGDLTIESKIAQSKIEITVSKTVTFNTYCTSLDEYAVFGFVLVKG